MGIDWPPSPGMDIPSLQASIEESTALACGLGLNALILQVRPCADAFYVGSPEPWSSYLSGTQGLAPPGAFDPLQAWIGAARARGLRLYAWINPFRAGAPSVKAYAPSAPAQAHPEWILDLGPPGYLWLDPGIPEARAYVVGVISGIARAYDIDGIVIDDYFYPYKEQYPNIPALPDTAARLYPGDEESMGKYRREVTHSFVKELRQALADTRPGMPLGISPFGIYRPGRPPGIQGKDAYAEVWIDAPAWLREGLVDFMMPQLYWPISDYPHSFPSLLRFWLDENHAGRHVWPSIRAVPTSGGANGMECLSQILVERGMSPSAPGFSIYSLSGLRRLDRVSLDLLRQGPFADMALIPAFDWLRPGNDEAVISWAEMREEAGRTRLHFESENAREILVRIKPREGSERHILLSGAGSDVELDFNLEDIASISLQGIDIRGVGGTVFPVDIP
jgi:hypothetical protein